MIQINRQHRFGKFLYLSMCFLFHEQPHLRKRFKYKRNVLGSVRSLPPFSAHLISQNSVSQSYNLGVFGGNQSFGGSFPGITAMEKDPKGKKSFKNVVCLDKKSFPEPFSSEQPSLVRNVEQSEHRPTMVEETNSSGAYKHKDKASSSGTKNEKNKGKPKLDMKAYLANLSGVRDNILHLKQTSLFGFLIGETVDIGKIRPKLKNDWKIKGDIFVHERANGWFELRFTNPIERNRVWDGRPYHVFGQLLLLKPWKSHFDTSTESITQVDLWIRIPQLPVEYLTFDVLSTIILWNGLGTVVKLDPYTEKQQRLRYARLCINIDLLSINDNKIVVPDENANEHTYRVWFEDFPKGCGSCGDMSHTYNFCPLRVARNQAITITLSKPSSLKTTSGVHNGNMKSATEWETVGKANSNADKGKGVLINQDNMKSSGIKVIYKTDSSSSGSKSSKLSKSSTATVPKYQETSEVTKNQDPNEVFANSAQMTDPLKEGVTGKEPEYSPLSPPSQGNADEDESLQFLNEFLMTDADDDYGGDLSQEEIEALIANDIALAIPMEDSQSLQSFHSIANTSSVVEKMQNMDMMQPQASKSESSRRKGLFGLGDTASSVLKEEGAKKLKMDE